MKAFAYFRVSGKGQVEGDGFPRQREMVSQFAAKHGFEIVHEYTESFTGTAREDERPEFVTMMSAILGNGVRTIIIERMDRLAREYRVQEEVALYIAGHGVALWSADTEENITESLLGDPMKKALVQMRGIFAELDRSITVKKLAAARKRKREETGRCEGQKPYGDRPGEADVVKIMQGLRMGGKTYRQIADHLNETQAPTRVTGAKWYPATVSNILQANEPKQA